MAEWFARAVVAARVLIVVGWIAAAALMAVSLPTLRDAQTGALPGKWLAAPTRTRVPGPSA